MDHWISVQNLSEVQTFNSSKFAQFCTLNRTTHHLCQISRRFPQFTAVIPAHWLEQGFISKLDGTLLSVCLVFLILVSYGANTLWLVIYLRNQNLQTPTNKLAISLILADFLMMTKTWLLVINSFAGGPILGTPGCIAFASFGTQAGLVQIWTITIISLDRANAIHYPIVKSKRFTHNQVCICVGTIWVITAIFSVAPIFGWNQYVSEAYFLGCSFDTWSHEFWDQMYVYTLMVLGYFIPLIIICMSYLKIFWFTRQSRQCVLNHMRQIQSQLLDTTKNEQEHESSFMEATFSGNGHGTTGHNLLCSDQYAEEFLRKTLEKEKCLARMALFIIGVWIFTWTPYATIAMLQEHGLGHWISPGISLTALTLAKCSSIINTFIYGLRLPHFKKHVNQILPWFSPSSQSKSSIKGGMALGLRKGPPLDSKKRMLKRRRRQDSKLDSSVKGDLSNSNSKTTSKTQHVSVSEIRVQQVQKNLEIEQAKFEELCKSIEARWLNGEPSQPEAKPNYQMSENLYWELKADLAELVHGSHLNPNSTRETHSCQ